MTAPQEPIRIAIAAMGGQGGGVLADWLVDLAEHAGWHAQSTSVPGVAQRTGATIYYLELFPRDPETSRAPVLALMPVPGDVDIVVAGELVEAGRAVLRGLVTPDRTTLVVSNHRDYALTEKMAMGDGRSSTERLEDGIHRAAQRCIAFDMAAAAERTGSVISAVLFGAVAGSGALPFERRDFEETIRRGGVGVEASLRAFAAGHDQASGTSVPPGHDAAVRAQPPVGGHESLLAAAGQTFPPAVQSVIEHALPRLSGYLDLEYAREYLDLLRPVLAADGDAESRLTVETARHLALWMSYEDTIRVAQQKIRPDRIERIRAETGAKSGQVVHVVEFLHPRVEEVCDTLPAALGRLVLGNRALRGIVGLGCRRGWRIRTTGPAGYLLLHGIASLRPWRRQLLRHANEMAAIREWMERIATTAAQDYALAVEIARAQRLVKGYGDTHLRGMGNFRRIMDCLDTIRRQPDPGSRLRGLCDAALADEDGATLRAALAEIPAAAAS